MASIVKEDTKLCPIVEGAFELLGRKWVGLIVHVLAEREFHFSELEKAIPPLSARMLAARVKELEEAGLVARTVHTGSPIRVTYALTEKGRDLVPVLGKFVDWAHKWHN